MVYLLCSHAKRKTQKVKTENGNIYLFPKNVKNQYLAYHEGQSGYARGSYRNKAWLLKVANKVERRSSMYRRQLKECGRL